MLSRREGCGKAWRPERVCWDEKRFLQFMLELCPEPDEQF